MTNRASPPTKRAISSAVTCKAPIMVTRRSGNPWGSGKPNEWRTCQNKPLVGGDYCKRHQPRADAIREQRIADLRRMTEGNYANREDREWAKAELARMGAEQ